MLLPAPIFDCVSAVIYLCIIHSSVLNPQRIWGHHRKLMKFTLDHLCWIVCLLVKNIFAELFLVQMILSWICKTKIEYISCQFTLEHCLVFKLTNALLLNAFLEVTVCLLDAVHNILHSDGARGSTHMGASLLVEHTVVSVPHYVPWKPVLNN